MKIITKIAELDYDGHQFFLYLQEENYSIAIYYIKNINYASLIIISPDALSVLNIYDGGDSIGFINAWDWGKVSFADSNDFPFKGAFCGKLAITNKACGIAHLRDPSWMGMDAFSAIRRAPG